MSATDTQPDDLDGEAATLRSQRLWKATAQQDLDFESQRLRNRLRERMFGVAAGPVSIGRFKVLETVGSGGMGVVYAAYDEELDRRVAVKLLRSRPGEGDSIGRSRLLREAQALAKLSHPHVVQVYEAGTFDDHVFVAMEFLSGLTMRAWLLEQPRPWRDVLTHFIAAGQGLAAAHRTGVIHRDFKPANLLFGADGRIRVVDFGLARAEGPVRAAAPAEGASAPREDPGDPFESTAIERGRSFAVELTQTGEIMGTPAYMSPEQACQERVDARSDQYSFCVALYEALFGRRPHQGRSPAEVLVAVAEGVVLPPPRNTRVPARVVRAIMRGLSAQPDQRFADMDALLAELRLDAGTRRRWLGLGGLAAAALIATAIVTDDRDPCPSFEDSIEQAWGSSQRAALQSALAASDAPGAAQVAEHVGAQLDAYASRWLGARHDVCEAHLVRRQESA
ncbi:MAG: serine/threonine-protein kinase, partial [Nannocystaceae bacterium]